MNENPGIDLYSLHLVRLVARHRGFTAASAEAGISQSALTRQVQRVEADLGVPIFERTTRKVNLSEAGAVFLRETEALPNILAGALRRVREEYLETPRQIKVGFSLALAHAHIPGIFHAHQRRCPGVPVLVSQMKSSEILQAVSAARLDLGIVSDGSSLPGAVEIIHEIPDEFCAVSGRNMESEFELPKSLAEFRAWAKSQKWLLPGEGSESRELVDDWTRRSRFQIEAAMELESFDLMNQFVSLGMGVALVPRRSLSTIRRKHLVQKINLPRKLSRKLIVIVPSHGRTPEHVRDFIEGILF